MNAISFDVSEKLAKEEIFRVCNLEWRTCNFDEQLSSIEGIIKMHSLNQPVPHSPAPTLPPFQDQVKVD